MGLRVCIDARLESGVLGGVEQVVIGLAASLSRLDDGGEEEYLFLTTSARDEWIRPYLGGACRAMPAGEPPIGAARRYRLRRLLAQRLPFVRPGLTPPVGPKDVMVSDGTIELAGADLVHFPCQMAFLTEVPSIYHPHDLQHVHLPELFPARDVELRDLWYRAFCEQASLVAVMTEWGREDLIEQYGVADERIAVVPWGSVLDAYPEPSAADLEAARGALDLPESFLLYPAQTWPHKNHEGLLEALALLREQRGVAPPLVCTGHLYRHHGRIEERVRKLGLEGSVRFTGFVSAVQLRSLYALARALVFPSKFEGWGMPVTEAFSVGLPVACSSATVLPEVAGDAALQFDPDRPREIADSIWRLWTDPALREELARRGRRRADGLSFDHAARTFRAHYRRIAGRPLSDVDRELVLESVPSAEDRARRAALQSPTP